MRRAATQGGAQGWFWQDSSEGSERAGGEVTSVAETVVPRVRRRPKDRKDQILEQAVRLFIDRGFHSVTLEEIAEAAGVTARALYRHYDNKQALLAAAILAGQNEYQNATRPRNHETDSPTPPLSVELPNLIAAAIATRSLTVLWQREARYLDDGERADVRRRINAIVAGMDDAVCLEIPDLSPQHSELRAWAVSSTVTSLGLHNLSLPGEELNALLYQACMAAARTPPVRELNADDRLPIGDSSPYSRRETLLATGAHLFRARGYPAVSTSDIGKGAGIAGPGLYRSFASKQAILDALIRRLDEWRSLECIRVLRASLGPSERLRAFVEGHVRISLDDPDLVAVSITELSHASADVSEAFARNRADREAEWLNLIRELVPRTTVAEARLLVAAATSFIEDVARTWHLTRNVGVAEEITAIALSILTSRSPAGEPS
ncbi:TetR family transcriptional regulator [Mycobacterium antarcticum]|nr:TetR family transcriptional regulator [Mycolicibacterium sp. TUM20985]